MTDDAPTAREYTLAARERLLLAIAKTDSELHTELLDGALHLLDERLDTSPHRASSSARTVERTVEEVWTPGRIADELRDPLEVLRRRARGRHVDPAVFGQAVDTIARVLREAPRATVTGVRVAHALDGNTPGAPLTTELHAICGVR